MTKGAQALRIAIIGAGASGIMAAIKLREADHDDVTIYEKAHDLGGTWRDNRYPGLTCDVPSHAYRFSFAPNPDWTRICAPGWEIQDYMRAVARDFGVDTLIRYNEEVKRAEYCDGQWRIDTTSGPKGAFDVVIAATGVLHHPAFPDIEGRDSFAGPAFHTARWDDSVSLKGKRVGLIGTGSTAVQIVGDIIGDVAQVSLFQRTPQWIARLENAPIPDEDKARYRQDPQWIEAEYQRLNHEHGVKFAAAIVGENPRAHAAMRRACEDYLATVRDPDLRARLTPDYEVGCKRLIMSDAFYEAIQQPNAELVTDAIARIEPDGVRTRDGRLHELDILVFATGFDAHAYVRPMNVIGQGGLSIDQAWAQGNKAYFGLMAPGFPNFFMLGGPNSPIGNFSFLLTVEKQFAFAMALIEKLRTGAAREIAPLQSATDAFNAAVLAKLPTTVWASGCKSWYFDKNGNVDSWPWSYGKFIDDMRAPNLADFHIA